MSTGVPRYAPLPETWDEALLPSGFPRRHWRSLATSLGRMGFRALSERWRTGQQIIQANGITYNVYGDPQGKERPWLMDPLPLVIDADEWEYIERSVTQRATLLNAVLGDLYGEQRLIQNRAVPAALLFANPNFLRACSHIVPPRGVYLNTYAVDLAR